MKAELYEERDEEEHHLIHSHATSKDNTHDSNNLADASELEAVSTNAKLTMDDDTKILYNFLVKCRLPQTKQIIKQYEKMLQFRHALVKECLKWGICFRRQMSFRSKDE